MKDEDVTSLMGTYCAAYYNLGVSYEHLRKFKVSGQAFVRAHKICTTHMPTNFTLLDSLNEAIESLHSKEYKENEQIFMRSVAQQSVLTNKERGMAPNKIIEKSRTEYETRRKMAGSELSLKLGGNKLRHSMQPPADRKWLEGMASHEIDYLRGK